MGLDRNGQIQQIKVAYPAKVQPLKAEQSGSPTKTLKTKSKVDEVTSELDKNSMGGNQDQNNELWDQPVALDHPTPEQQVKLRIVVREVSHLF